MPLRVRVCVQMQGRLALRPSARGCEAAAPASVSAMFQARDLRAPFARGAARLAALRAILVGALEVYWSVRRVSRRQGCAQGVARRLRGSLTLSSLCELYILVNTRQRNSALGTRRPRWTLADTRYWFTRYRVAR